MRQWRKSQSKIKPVVAEENITAAAMEQIARVTENLWEQRKHHCCGRGKNSQTHMKPGNELLQCVDEQREEESGAWRADGHLFVR